MLRVLVNELIFISIGHRWCIHSSRNQFVLLK